MARKKKSPDKITKDKLTNHCHYSDLPSPMAYEKKEMKIKKYVKWTPVAIALLALFYSVGLGVTNHVEEALYSSHWPVTLLVFYLVIDKINKQ